VPEQLGIYFPLQPRDPRQLAPFGRLVAAGHADRLWLGQSLNLDSHQVLAYLLGQGISPPLGVGLSVMPLNHPYQAALAARSLAALSGKPLSAVFGTGTPVFQEALLGAPYRSPLKAAEGYLTAVARLLDGRSSDGGKYDGREGGYGRSRGTHGSAAARLDPALAGAPRVELGLGVLQKGMAKLAVRTTDAALTWMTPLPYLRGTLLPALGARAAGGPRVVSVVHVLVYRPGRDVPEMALRATRSHLSGPHYRRALATAGLNLSESGTHTGKEIVDHGVVLAGTAREIAARISAYWAVGIDEVVLNPCALVGEGTEEALRDLLEITAACRAEAQSHSEESGWLTRT
jgi:alkanesulfonate monooxygenase SsuD/methylene tetrahydromethanopterin reductase-like flavin-dependent oxidoreductase (luciferase family)